MSTSAMRNELLEALWPAGLSPRMQVWMILDAARDSRIYGAVDGCYLEKCCLYGGDLPWQLQMTAPYLVGLRKDDRFTEFVIDNGWGQAWGVFVRSEAGMQSLRHHLRRFLRVRGPRGQRLLFRYYDPRVMRLYLPTCYPQELETVYGPVSRYLMEADDAETLLEYGFDGTKLSEERIPLGAGRSQSASPGHR